MKAHADCKRHAKERTTYLPGQQILVKNFCKTNKLEPFYETMPYNVLDVYDIRSVRVGRNGKTYIRNNAHIKTYNCPETTYHSKSSRQTINSSTTDITITFITDENDDESAR